MAPELALAFKVPLDPYSSGFLSNSDHCYLALHLFGLFEESQPPILLHLHSSFSTLLQIELEELGKEYNQDVVFNHIAAWEPIASST